MRRKLVSLFALMVLATFLAGSIAPVTAAGELITTTKSEIKANVPVKYSASGLTASTFYTCYAGSTLKANRSVSATGTTLEFKFAVSDTLVGTYLTIYLKDSAGTNTLSSLTLEVVDVIPQYTIDMLGGFIPLVMVFGAVFGAMGGVVAMVMKIFK